MRRETLSGAESDQALVESVRAAGNVILLADATYNADSGESRRRCRTRASRSTAPGASSGASSFRRLRRWRDAGSALGHNLFVLDPDGPLRHTVPFVRAGTHVLPSLGVAAALRAAGIAPRDVRFDGDRLRHGRSRDAAVVASRARARTASRAISGGSSIFAARRCSTTSRAHLPDLFVLRSAGRRAADPQRPQAGDRSGAVPRQDRLRRHDGIRPLRRLRNAVLERQDARHQHPRRRRRRRAVQSLHPRGEPGRPRRDGHRGRAGHRPRRDDDARVVGDRGDRRVHRRARAGSRCGCSAAATG